MSRASPEEAAAMCDRHDLQRHDQAGRSQVVHERRRGRQASGGQRQERGGDPVRLVGIGRGGLDAKAALFWAFVGITVAWGAWITLKNAMRIF